MDKIIPSEDLLGNPSWAPALQVMAASVTAEALSYCMERRYLHDIPYQWGNTYTNGFALKSNEILGCSKVSWIQITQIGHPLEKSAASCFTAIQKILHTCFIPDKAQLLFLIIGGKDDNHLYLGLRGIDSADSGAINTHIRNLMNFMEQGVWPGLQAEIVGSGNEEICSFSKLFDEKNGKLQDIYALTGIPSMESQYEQLYPATTDMLMAGMRHCERFAYLVIADPINTEEVNDMLYRCREIAGQAESLKSVNVTNGASSGQSRSTSISHSQGITTNKKDTLKLGCAVAAKVGLNLVSTSLLGLPLPSTGLLTQLIPTTTTKNESDSYGQSIGESESLSQSIGRNVVNEHIAYMAEQLNHHTDRLEKGRTTGLWEVGVYLMADNDRNAQSGALQLRSLLSGNDSTYEPVRIHKISDTKNIGKHLGNCQAPQLTIYENNEPYNHPLGERFQRLTSVLTTKELSYMINFPLRAVPGISVVDSSPAFNLSTPKRGNISIGRILYGGSLTELPYSIPTSSLSRHILISGISGSGKTNTVTTILNNIGSLPFLIIEPAKTEYVDWAISHNNKGIGSKINIYMPGCKTYKGQQLPQLQINPFEVIFRNQEKTSSVLSHIDRLKSTFAAAFPMYDILPVLMEDLIYTIYSDPTSDWMSGKIEENCLFPTLNSMKMWVDKVIDNHKYEEHISRNMKACLNTRINSLMRGWKGEMLNTTKSTPLKKIFDNSTVINLSNVGDDVDKGFFMSLILQFLYEYRSMQVEQENPKSNSCRHITIIEEAHRVMSKCDNPELPQSKTAMMFSNMLSEIRAYGEGFLLVDQAPTRLIPDAIKNTNLKIVHRLVAEDDCRAIGESMGLNSEQRLLIPRLLTGQCIVSESTSPNPYWIKVTEQK